MEYICHMKETTSDFYRNQTILLLIVQINSGQYENSRFMEYKNLLHNSVYVRLAN